MKTRKTLKLMSVLLTAVMMLTVMSVLGTISAFAESPAYSGGTGTQDDPYLLSTPDDLVALGNAIASDDGSLDAVDTCGLGMYHGYYFELTQDIDMTGVAWTPMSFCGNLDGKGYAIKNLNTVATDNGDGEYWTGFFAQLINATVSNITFDGCTATIGETVSSTRDIYAAIVAANAIASKMEGVAVVNSSISHKGSFKNISYAGFVVALTDIAHITGCRVENSAMDIDTQDPSMEVGGIAGGMGDTFFEFIHWEGNPYNMTIGVDGKYGLYDCYVDATITSSAIGYTAGIVGFTCTDYLDDIALVPERNGVAVEIKNCVFVGDITVTSASGIAAGISGYDEPEDVIDGCVNMGTLSATAATHPLGTFPPATVTNSYYIADTQDGNGGYTAEQFADGTVCTARGGHFEGNQYKHDYSEHWLACEICGDKIATTVEAHDGEDECSVCTWISTTALLTTLEASVANLETSIADGDKALAGDIDAVEQALAEAQTALEKADADNKALLEQAIADARTALQDAIDQVQANLEQAQDDLEKAIADGDTALDEKIIALNAQLKATEALLKANDLALEKKLTNAMNEADAALQTAIDKVASDLAQAQTDLNKAIADGDKALDEKMTALDSALKTAESALKAVDADLQKQINDAKATLQSAIDKVASDLAQAQADLNKAIADGDKALDDKITALTEALATAKATLEKADADNKAALETAIADAAATADTAIKAVQKNLDDAKTALETAIADGDTALDEKMTLLGEALATAKTVLETADATNKTALETAIADGDAALDTAIKAVQKALDDAKTALEQADADNKATLEKADADNKADLEDAIAQAKKDAQVLPVVLAAVSLAGNIALVVWLILMKRKKGVI